MLCNNSAANFPLVNLQSGKQRYQIYGINKSSELNHKLGNFEIRLKTDKFWNVSPLEFLDIKTFKSFSFTSYSQIFSVECLVGPFGVGATIF